MRRVMMSIAMGVIIGMAWADSPTDQNSVAVQADSSYVRTDSVSVSQPDKGEELVLEAIEIKGRVDKPGVIILPKRVEPEMEKIELERSFQFEVKNGLEDAAKPDEQLRKVESVRSIEKTVEKKRDKGYIE